MIRRRSRTLHAPAVIGLVGIAGVILLPTGCVVGPEYERPEVVVPDAFRFDASGELDAGDVAWWSAFGDPVLDALVAEALANNLDVRIAAARVEEFAARIGISRSAAFPQVNAGGGLGRSSLSREIAPGSAGGSRTSDFFNANLNVGWELDIWGRIRRATDAARSDALASTEVRRGVVLTLVTSVATSYVGLRSLDAQLEVAREKLETRAGTLDIFERQFAQGVISKLELAQIRSEYERTAATIPGIVRDIARLENSLSVLLGRPPGDIDRGRTIATLAMPPIPAGLPAQLLRQRPDLQAAELAMMSANARIGVAAADFYPRVSLSGTLGLASDDLSRLIGSSAVLSEVAGGIAAPIFTAGLLESQLAVAEASEREAVEQFRRAWLTALLESEDALVTRSTTAEEVAAQGRQTDALSTYASLAQVRYDNGYVGYLEVLDAERDLFDAELTQIRLRASLHTSVIGIYKAFGGGWVTVAEDVADEAEAADAAAAASAAESDAAAG